MISNVQAFTKEKSKGRPLKQFNELTDRNKRQPSEDLVKAHSPAQLSFVASLSLRASWSSGAASVIKNISTKSSSEVEKIKKVIDADVNPGKEISGDLSLSDLVEGKMTRKTYRFIKKKRSREWRSCVSLI